MDKSRVTKIVDEILIFIAIVIMVTMFVTLDNDTDNLKYEIEQLKIHHDYAHGPTTCQKNLSR